MLLCSSESSLRVSMLFKLSEERPQLLAKTNSHLAVEGRVRRVPTPDLKTTIFSSKL